MFVLKLYSYALHNRTKQQRWRIIKGHHVHPFCMPFVDTSSSGYNCYRIPYLLVVCYLIVDFAHSHAEGLIVSQLHMPAYLLHLSKLKSYDVIWIVMKPSFILFKTTVRSS